MKIVYAWKPHALPVDYWLTNSDGHFESFRYLSRYYDLSLVVGGFEGTLQRDGFTIHGCGMDPRAFAAKIQECEPDALVCYGPIAAPEWALYRSAAPRAFFCLDYGGGPLTSYNGEVLPQAHLFDHLFVAHETQAETLRALGLPASKARGVNLEHYKPIPGVPKLWKVFCPQSFTPGKRNPLVAQVLEQYGPEKPSLFLGTMEHPAVIEMTRCGGIPLNKVAPTRNHIQLGGRAPYCTMPLLFNASEVVVIGSAEDAGPWVAMEALACGIPTIIMSDCQWGVAEAFHTLEREGFWPGIQVVDPWPAGIYHAIEQATADPTAAARARLLAVKHYDWWSQYEITDQVLKNGVAFKQNGQAAA